MLYVAPTGYKQDSKLGAVLGAHGMDSRNIILKHMWGTDTVAIFGIWGIQGPLRLL